MISFQGENNVTWGEVFKLLLLAVGVEEPERDPEKHWAYPYVQLASSRPSSFLTNCSGA